MMVLRCSRESLHYKTTSHKLVNWPYVNLTQLPVVWCCIVRLFRHTRRILVYNTYIIYLMNYILVLRHKMWYKVFILVKPQFFYHYASFNYRHIFHWYIKQNLLSNHDVTWARWFLKSPINFFNDSSMLLQNTKAPHFWPYMRGIVDDRPIPRTKSQ